MPDFIKKNLKFIIAGSLLLILFYSFSFLVKEDVLKQFDFDMSVRIQSNVPIRIDPYLSILSLLGSFEGTIIILGVFTIMRRKVGGIIALFMFCFMHIVELVGKAFLDHPSTPFMFHRYAFDFVFPTGYVQPGGSYPSGHAMRAAFLAIMFIFYINRRTKLSSTMKQWISGAIVVFYLLMAISRISLGEHWTSDVIGGTILGTAFSILSLIFI